jgi:hypothetical protein
MSLLGCRVRSPKPSLAATPRGLQAHNGTKFCPDMRVCLRSLSILISFIVVTIGYGQLRSDWNKAVVIGFEQGGKFGSHITTRFPYKTDMFSREIILVTEEDSSLISKSYILLCHRITLPQIEPRSIVVRKDRPFPWMYCLAVHIPMDIAFPNKLKVYTTLGSIVRPE